MTLKEMINEYGKDYRPYMNGLVNHLPMAQLAIFKMMGDLDKVKRYSDVYVLKMDINPIRPTNRKVNNFEECLGEVDAYEACLAFVEKEIEKRGLETVVREVLNAYALGMSAGLFHVTIRLGYALEGYRMDPTSTDEVARSLSYYITAYRKAIRLEKKISGDAFKESLERMLDDKHLRNLVTSGISTGSKLKALYTDDHFISSAFTIDGNEASKVKTLLNILLDYYNKSGNFLILHCITGLHALLMLKPYFDDFNDTLDVYTTCMIGHVLSLQGLKVHDFNIAYQGISWDEIIESGANDKDVHTIKFTYTCSELYKMYEIEALKKAAMIKKLH